MKNPIPMKPTLFAIIVALSTTLFAGEEVVSKSAERDLKVVGITGEGKGTGEIRLMAGAKVIWEEGLTYGVPNQTVVSWSPHSTKVAISVRGTKWSSEVHVFDTWKQLKELPIPDFRKMTIALNSGIKGRYTFAAPVGWIDEETLVLRCDGNLVDGGSDGFPAANFQYQVTYHVPTRRVLSVTCISQHDLNDKSIKQGGEAEAAPAVVPGGDR